MRHSFDQWFEIGKAVKHFLSTNTRVIVVSKLGSQLQRCDIENLVWEVKEIEWKKELSTCLGRCKKGLCIERSDKTLSDRVLAGCTFQGERLLYVSSLSLPPQCQGRLLMGMFEIIAQRLRQKFSVRKPRLKYWRCYLLLESLGESLNPFVGLSNGN